MFQEKIMYLVKTVPLKNMHTENLVPKKETLVHLKLGQSKKMSTFFYQSM